ncbi:Y-family DNA polymerase [Vibrio sp. E150_011]
MLLWLYLHFPTLQLDTLFRQDDDDVALAIVDGHQHDIIQLNTEAQKQGLQLGMGLGSAAALCQDLQVHPYDAKLENQRLADIAQWLYLITSDITLFPPNGILIKVTNMLSLYENIENYWRALSQHLAHLHINTYYSTGQSPYAAMIMAKQKCNWIETNPQQLKKRMSGYSLSLTELETKQVEKLQRVGIQNLSDLLALSLPEVAKRFDIELVNYVGRLTGQFKHPINFHHPPEQFSHYLELLFDIENVAWLHNPLTRLFQQLEVFLRLRDKVAYELNLTLHQRDHDDSHIQLHSAQGDYLVAKWQSLSTLTLENLQIDAAINGLTLSVIRMGEHQINEYDLFEGITSNQTPLELVSILQAKLGKQAVTSLHFTDDPRPEMATQPIAFSQTTHGPKAPFSKTCQKLRPSLLYPHPFPLTDKVSITLGPERVISGWWDGYQVKRDYFIARNAFGQWLWIFRTEDYHWFVHGQFS